MSTEGTSKSAGRERRAKEAAELKERLDAERDKREKEHKKDLFRRRVELARTGVKAYMEGKHAESVRSFMMYIKILEEWKGVGEGQLDPKLFDVQKDTAELLLISGVFWDLTKLFDKTKSKRKEFRHYLGKYILFNKGMPYQAIAAESLRKYISLDKAKNRGDFKSAYRSLTGNNCFVATSLLDVVEGETIERLRRFRDEVLNATVSGRQLVCTYECVGPALAERADRLPQPVRWCMGKQLDLAARAIAWAALKREQRSPA